MQLLRPPSGASRFISTGENFFPRMKCSRGPPELLVGVKLGVKPDVVFTHRDFDRRINLSTGAQITWRQSELGKAGGDPQSGYHGRSVGTSWDAALQSLSLEP